jgi:tetratricopeptide (TPR) repeat protein/outer membrane protein assembly factor BamB
MRKVSVVVFLLVFSFFILTGELSNASILAKKFSYKSGTIREIFFEDLDGDGILEIILLSGDTISVLDSRTGSLHWTYSHKNILSISVSDLDGNGEKEIIFTSGRSVAGIARCFLWILNKDGKMIVKYPPSKVGLTISLNVLSVPFDLDKNNYKEIVVGTSQGVCVFKDTYDGISWYNPQDIPDTIQKIIIEDISGDGRGDILAKAFSRIYMIDADGNVLWNYSIPNGIATMHLKDLREGDSKKIILLSASSQNKFESELLILNNEGNVTNQIIIPKSVILGIYSSPFFLFIENLDDDYGKEILLSIDKDLYFFDDDFKKKGNYSFSEEIKGIFFENFHSDDEEEIIVFTTKVMSRFSKNLSRKKFTYDDILTHDIDKVFFQDIDGNGEDEIIINSFGYTYFFTINKTFLVKESADKLYEQAVEYFNLKLYENATSYLTTARKIYEQVRDIGGLLNCKLLLSEIEEKLRGEKLTLANSYYEKAEFFYNISEYENATYYLILARDIFIELGNTERILKSNQLLKNIKDIQTGETMEETRTTITSFTPIETTVLATPTISRDEDKQPSTFILEGIPLLLISLLLALLVLSVGFVFRKRIRLK